MPYKDALEEKLQELQEEYANTKYNKATDKHLGKLRERMAKLRREIAEKSKKRRGKGFGVKKAGDATAVLVGFPKAGKSSLLNALAGTDSKVADYAFTTLDAIPGMLEYSGAKIQLIDLPGIIKGAHIGKGDGAKVASVMRTADILLIVVDSTSIEQLKALLEELYLLGIRLNKERPSVEMEKTSRGGIQIAGAISQNDREELSKALLSAGIYNANVAIAKPAPIDEILDFLLGSVTYIKAIIVLNKIDLLSKENAERAVENARQISGAEVIAVSAATGENLETLKEAIFKSAGLIRIYLKPKDSEPDFKKPLIVKSGSNIEDIARKLNAKTSKYLKYALVNGASVKFPNQKVGKDHVVKDKDVVTLVYEKHV